MCPTSARERRWGELPLRYAGRGKAAEIDDTPDARGVGLFGEDPGGLAVGPLEAGSGAEGVDEVVGDVDVPHGVADGLGVGHVAAYGLGPVGPGVVAQFRGRTGEAAHPVPGVQQLRHEPAADVAGGAGDQTVECWCRVRTVRGVAVRHAVLRRPCASRPRCPGTSASARPAIRAAPTAAGTRPPWPRPARRPPPSGRSSGSPAVPATSTRRRRDRTQRATTDRGRRRASRRPRTPPRSRR